MGRSQRGRRGRKGRGYWATAFLTWGIVGSTVACNSLLDVTNPGRVPADALNDPSLAPVLEAAALGEFECAYAQYVATTGVLAGEYIVSSFFVNTNIWGWRGVEIKTEPGSCPTTRAASSLGYYTPLQSARYVAEDATARMEQFTDAQVPERTKILAGLAAYSAYAYTLLGEGFCDMVIDAGPRMTRTEVLEIAEERFTNAIDLAQTAGDNDLRSMALVGRARVRLDLGKLPDAAADAEQVPEGYVRNAQYSESRPRRENRVYNMTIRNDFLSVASEYRDLTVGGVPDSRVAVVNTGRLGQDDVTPQWAQMKYPLATSPIPIASWREAQLILAEARGGQAARDAIDGLRATAGLPLLSESDGSDVQALVLEERRRELFSTGQRYNDMLRNDIPFPAGTNHKGQSYGPTTCVPLPDQETFNNPNLGLFGPR